ncbi:unnamed protein product [Prunus armeniaca]
MEDEYDYDALEVFESDSMNTPLTRIYEKFMGPNGQPMEYEPLVRNGRQVDLMGHLWAMRGNESE